LPGNKNVLDDLCPHYHDAFFRVFIEVVLMKMMKDVKGRSSLW